LTVAFLPINAVDRFIVVYLGSSPVLLSKMPVQKSLTLILGCGYDLVRSIFAQKGGQ
jgi:hypothetical protein